MARAIHTYFNSPTTLDNPFMVIDYISLLRVAFNWIIVLSYHGECQLD